MLISVVTVCYNAKDVLEATILSVISQTYKELEYIVIDGASKDGTRELIKKYEKNIAYYMSEPDKGIYDAMNKGIKAAKGDYIIFMNAGDCFCSETTLNDWVLAINNRFADVYYGDVILRYAYGARYLRALPLDGIRKTMVFSHQSVMVSSQILKNKPFDISYRFAADYDCLLRCYLGEKSFLYSPVSVAIVEMDKGATASNYFDSKKEVLGIHKACGYSWAKRYYYFIYMMAQYYVHGAVKFIIPSSWTKKVQNKL